MILKRKVKELPVPFYTTCDIETSKTGKALAIGLAWYTDDVREYRVFEDWQSFLDFIIPLSKKNASVRKIYAHNGANFDYISLTEFLLESGQWEKIKIVMSGSKGIGLDINLGNKKGTLRLRDSLCLLLSSLEKLSESFKPEYPKLKIDVLPEELLETNPDKFYEYLKGDCFALQDILRAFHILVNEKIGKISLLPMTISALSYKLWRDNYLDTAIMTGWKKELKEFWRRSYRGGRVEVFEPGEYEDVNGYDINSLYPFIMQGFEVPIGYLGAWVDYYRGKGIYEVEFEQTDKKIPAILADEEKLEFVYKGKGVFCSPELDKFLKHGKIKIIKGYSFIKWGNPFKSYIQKLYALRLAAKKENDSALDHITKICMNSLYGKFGEKPEGEDLRCMPIEEVKKLIEQKVEVTSHGNCYSVKTERVCENEFVPIASFITSNARLELFKYLEKGGVIYCDTDSVYTVKKLPENMIGEGLGFMKKIFKGRGIFTGKKQYALRPENGKEKFVLKGVTTSGPNKADIEYEDFKVFLKGGSKKYSYITCTTVRDVLINNEKACLFRKKSRVIKMTAKR